MKFKITETFIFINLMYRAFCIILLLIFEKKILMQLICMDTDKVQRFDNISNILNSNVEIIDKQMRKAARSSQVDPLND